MAAFPLGRLAGRRRWIAAAVVAGVLVAAALTLPVEDAFFAGVEWMRAHPVAGVVLYVAIYGLACAAMVPATPLTLAGAYIFPSPWDYLLVPTGAAVGGIGGLAVGRYLARGWVRRKIAGHAGFAAVDAAVGQKGFTIVFLARLVPVLPFGLLNYAFGLTSVPIGRYAVATFFGVMPISALLVYTANLITSLAQLREGDFTTPGHTVLLVGGFFALLLLITYVTRVATRAYRQALESPMDQAERA